MAAALLAALFAMGAFSASGVGAAVETGSAGPQVMLLVDGTENNKPGAAVDTTLRVTFQVDDEVDGAGNVVDDVVVFVPAGLITGIGDTATGSFASATEVTTGVTFASKVTAKQGEGTAAEDVGMISATWDAAANDVRDGLTITIKPAESAEDNLKAGEMVTVEISELRITQANMTYDIGIQQKGSLEQTVRTARLFAITGAKAYKQGNDLMIEFTSALAQAEGGNVVITLEETTLVATDPDVSATPATTTLDTIAAGKELTLTGYNAGKSTITIAGKGTVGETVTIKQGTAPAMSAVVGEIPSNPVGKTGTSEMNEGGTISSRDAGAADVRLVIKASKSVANLERGGSITVDLKGFVLPALADVSESDVIIDGKTITPNTEFYGNPDSVRISGSVVTLSLPATNRDGSPANTLLFDPETPTDTVDETPYEIIFKPSFGLGNPAKAGEYEISVDDGDTTDPEKKSVTIVSTVKVDPTFVTRGAEAKVTVKGLADGAVTVHLLDEDGDRGTALGSSTAANGVAEISISTSSLKAGATPVATKPDAGLNTLIVVDANNAELMAGDDRIETKLGIKPTVKLGSDTVERSGDLEISVSDWYYGTINKVTIGGVPVVGAVSETVPSDMDADNYGKKTFTVTVDGDVRTGEQKVVVTGANVTPALTTVSASATVTVEALALDVSPLLVVPGQQVTITGMGFEDSTDVTDSITIGGKAVTRPSDARTTSSGRVAVTVMVPVDVGDGDKKVNLSVGSRTGEGTITVKKPSIELNPSTSVPGSVISVTGSGFDSGGRVEVKYAGNVEEVGKADSGGEFHIRLTVPSNAGIGQPNDVEVQSRTDKGDDINAKAEHKTPGSMITLEDTAQVGSMTTISGTNFAVFSQLTVKIGSLTVTPTPAPETDKNGAFEVMARVPRIAAGSHTVTVTDAAGNSATETFTVVTTPVVSTPQEVFGVLGDKLTVVWRYDNATATWASYSPGAPAELNDLTGVSRGDIVWIQVTADVEFQGQTLYLGTTGWNLITLE